ncbi:protein ALP1-like [Humulus lupulus]|uniref:protein ALP1-like n=1 Tax=Humulus lupulus TaxID=3486 RepID=UPI002B41645B|nr:protein ALP1-like [Humulus lupulus]XP_062080264.1 protein ALP1-like [Humulus lupulus]
MVRLTVSERQILRKKKIMTLYLHWMNVLHVVQWFFKLWEKIIVHGIESSSLGRQLYILDVFVNRQIVHQIAYESDIICFDQLRMNRKAFSNLCIMLETRGGLKASKYLQVDEQVAMFLHVIAHHVKNRVIRFRFMRSGETISKFFHNVLHSIIRLHGALLKRPEPVVENSTDERWKWFKNCLGALDGTHIRVRVSMADKPKYRTRKGEIATNVLGVCSQDMQFIYVLPGWEGSAADGRVLRDAIRRTNGLCVPNGHYYLVDGGYTNCKGFLAPYRGQRYHLNQWEDGNPPRNPQEFFNMKHSSARNVIERCFGAIKNRWAILRSPSFYPIKTQNRIILACCLLHNFIRREMPNDNTDMHPENESDSGDEEDNMDVDGSIRSIEASEGWTTFRNHLALEMYNEWREHRRAS